MIDQSSEVLDGDHVGIAPPGSTRGRGLWAAVLVACFSLAQAASMIVMRRPLGHDEAVYLLRARDISELGWSTTGGGYWVDYRAPGLPLLAAGLGEAVGFHVTTTRLLVAVLGAGTVIATWSIARRYSGELGGMLAAAVVTASAGFVYSSSVLLADVPGTAFAMVAVAWFAADLDRGRLTASTWGVPLLALAACVSRFGAPFALGPGLAAVTILAIPRAWRERNVVLAGQVVLVGAAIALIGYLVLFTRFIAILDETPAQANSRLINGKGLTPASGFRDLVSVTNPWSPARFHMMSTVAFLVLALGVLAAVVAATLRRSLRLPVVAFGLASVTSLVGIVASVGLVVANYLVLTLPFWAVWAAIGWSWMIRSLASRVGERSAVMRVVLVIGVVAISWMGVEAARAARAEATVGTRSFEALRRTSAQIREAYYPDCFVVTSYTPQVGYYSGCRVEVYAPLDRPLGDIIARAYTRNPEVGEDWDDLVFVFEGGKRQPPDDEFDTSPALERERLFEEESNSGRAHTWVQEIEIACVFDGRC